MEFGSGENSGRVGISLAPTGVVKVGIGKGWGSECLW